MAPVPKKTKQHFTHPNHPLIHHSDDKEYLCNGCKTSGSGTRFRCHACDYNMHEYCADCPNELSSSVHKHNLALVVRKSQGARSNDRICDVCRDSVEGLFYRCKDCDFDVHPLCTQLPKELQHVIDKKHMLRLHKQPFGSCVVCKADCSSVWVYGCDVCKVNIHFNCLLEPYDSPSQEIPVPPPSQGRRSGPNGNTTSRGIPFAPPPWSTGPPPFSYGAANFDAFGGQKYGYGYGYGVPYGVPAPDYPYGYGYSFEPSYGFAPPPNYNVNHNYQQQSEVGNSGSSSGGKFGKSMFSLVGKLTLGVLSSAIFGTSFGF